MNFKQACDILGIEKKHTLEMIKKAYYKKALQLHPDKGGDETEFKLLHEAYQRVLAMESGTRRYDEDEVDFGDLYDGKIDYSKLLKKALRWLDKDITWDDTFVNTTFKNILMTCENASIEIFKKLSVEKSIKFLDIMKKHNLIFSLKSETVEKMREILRGKMNDNIIMLNIGLNDLLSDKIYKLILDDHEYYIPLWHKHFYIKNDKNKDIMVINKFSLTTSNPHYGNFTIKDNNDIWWKITIKLQALYEKKYHQLNIGNFSDKIYAKDLKIVKNQIYVLKNKGILKVNKKNIYDTTKRSDIYLDITLI